MGPLSTRDHVEALGLDGHEVGPGLVEERALGGRGATVAVAMERQ